MEKKAKKQARNEFQDKKVDKFLIKKTDRKTINLIFLPISFYPQIKNLNFVTFHNHRMSGVNSNDSNTISDMYLKIYL